MDGVGYDEPATQSAGVTLRQVRDDSQQRFDAQDDASMLKEARRARQVMETAQCQPVSPPKIELVKDSISKTPTGSIK